VRRLRMTGGSALPKVSGNSWKTALLPILAPLTPGTRLPPRAHGVGAPPQRAEVRIRDPLHEGCGGPGQGRGGPPVEAQDPPHHRARLPPPQGPPQGEGDRDHRADAHQGALGLARLLGPGTPPPCRQVAIEDLEQKLARLEAACTTLDIVLLQVPRSASLLPLCFDHLVRPVLRWSLAAWWPRPSTPAPWR